MDFQKRAYMGPIENASDLEAMNEGIDAIGREIGPYVFRIAPPELL
jgi:hypothetical protein